MASEMVKPAYLLIRMRIAYNLMACLLPSLDQGATLIPKPPSPTPTPLPPYFYEQGSSNPGLILGAAVLVLIIISAVLINSWQQKRRN
jgi:hypothetical protein